MKQAFLFVDAQTLHTYFDIDRMKLLGDNHYAETSRFKLSWNINVLRLSFYPSLAPLFSFNFPIEKLQLKIVWMFSRFTHCNVTCSSLSQWFFVLLWSNKTKTNIKRLNKQTKRQLTSLSFWECSSSLVKRAIFHCYFKEYFSRKRAKHEAVKIYSSWKTLY